MDNYMHSVYLDAEKCSGCTTCLRYCPTEAIRVRNGHAVIIEDRCIDCGQCIRVCPSKAKKSRCDSLDELENYKWKIALPAPALYGQFENLDDIDYVLDGLKKIGFDDVFEVSAAAEIVTAYTREYLKSKDIKRPAISSACPAVLRLVGLRFPSLADNIIHMLPPMEIAAKMARDKTRIEHPEFSDDEVGVFFISPCPAKASYVSCGFADYKSEVSSVISMSDVYFKLLGKMKNDPNVPLLSHSGMIGIGWATSGGEATAIFNENYLAADGIENVIHVLDQIETGSIPNLDFVELNACTGGCVGGVMTIQNPYIAKARLMNLKRYMPVSQNFIPDGTLTVPERYMFKEFPQYRPNSKFSRDFKESLRMQGEIEELVSLLPRLDCGACGAPNCRAHAEDIVRGKETVLRCPIMKLNGKDLKKAGE